MRCSTECVYFKIISDKGEKGSPMVAVCGLEDEGVEFRNYHGDHRGDSWGGEWFDGCNVVSSVLCLHPDFRLLLK